MITPQDVLAGLFSGNMRIAESLKRNADAAASLRRIAQGRKQMGEGKERATELEKRVLTALVEAWNTWVDLPNRDAGDDEEFSRAIHSAQMSIALRIARRTNPEIWRQPK